MTRAWMHRTIGIVLAAALLGAGPQARPAQGHKAQVQGGREGGEQDRGTKGQLADPNPADATILSPSTGSTFGTYTTINFSGASDVGVTFSWDFGDGATATGTLTPSHAYTTAGTYLIRFTASAPGYTSGIATISLTIAALPPTVTVTPAAPTLSVGGSQSFAATVTGLANGAVTWSATGGTITSAGVYTAGNTAGTFTVTATASNGTTTGTTSVVLKSKVTISPTAVTVIVGNTQPFTATVTGGTTVTWSATGGTITTAGVYTPPTGAGASYTVKATTSDGVVASAAVTTRNRPTFVSTLANKSLVLDQYFALTLPMATDPDAGATQAYTLTGTLPPGLTYNAANNFLSGIPTATGTYTLTETVTDDTGLSKSQAAATFTVTGTAQAVPPPPTLPTTLSAMSTAKFQEVLAYEWTDGSGAHRSDTGLITAVDVNRQLNSAIAGLTTAATRDQAIRSHYDYGYDPLGQLVSADGDFYNAMTGSTPAWTDTTTYSYDAHGNRKQHAASLAEKGNWTYTNYSGLVNGQTVDTNRLLSAGPKTFTHNADGAVTDIATAGTGETQHLDYLDPRFMRLPTYMKRMTSAATDNRTVESTLRYDMSGTRVYKRDFIHDTTDATKILSDRETVYLANGTEVLMEVENKGTSGVSAPDRYTAYIFGAGSRLARLSWDTDGRPATAGLLTQPVTNGDFTNGTAGWTSSNTTADTYQDTSLNEPTLRVLRASLTAPSFVEQSLGTTFPAGATVELSALVKNEAGSRAMLGLYQVGDGVTPHGGAGAVRIGKDNGTNSVIGRTFATQMQPNEVWTASVWFKAPTGTSGNLYLGNSGGAIHTSKMVAGNGAWQQIVLTGLTNTTGAAQSMYLYLYGDKITLNADTRVAYDDLLLTNTTTATTIENDDFEAGLDLVTAWSTVGWYAQGQNAEWVTATGATQLIPISASSWTTTTAPYKIRRTLMAGGELRARLLCSAIASNLHSYFDAVGFAFLPASTVANGKPNYWPDPGFEGVLDAGPEVTLVGTPTLQQDGTKREGLKLLQVPVGSTYTRKVSGLTYSKSYYFSVWKKVGTGAWQRETRTTGGADLGAVDSVGGLNVTLPSTADQALGQTILYDQAELVPWTTGDPTPEAWIPENRLGRVDWFVTDHLGSTKLLIDQTGTHRFTGDEDAFGVNLRNFGDKDGHRFTGQILDEEHGMYYFGARYYSPEIGRFVETDPHHQFYSGFLYGGNAPTLMVDPSGMDAIEPGDANSTQSPVPQYSPEELAAAQRRLDRKMQSFGPHPGDLTLAQKTTLVTTNINALLVGVALAPQASALPVAALAELPSATVTITATAPVIPLVKVAADHIEEEAEVLPEVEAELETALNGNFTSQVETVYNYVRTTGEKIIRVGELDTPFGKAGGANNGKMGDLIGWTKNGVSVADNAIKAQEIIKNIDFNKLRQAGVTADMALGWAKFYAQEQALVELSGSINANAEPRRMIMTAIAEGLQ